jgi:hypothetical protein
LGVKSICTRGQNGTEMIRRKSDQGWGRTKRLGAGDRSVGQQSDHDSRQL